MRPLDPVLGWIQAIVGWLKTPYKTLLALFLLSITALVLPDRISDRMMVGDWVRSHRLLEWAVALGSGFYLLVWGIELSAQRIQVRRHLGGARVPMALHVIGRSRKAKPAALTAGCGDYQTLRGCYRSVLTERCFLSQALGFAATIRASFRSMLGSFAHSRQPCALTPVVPNLKVV
jgi:hypothetical protein